MKILEVKYKGYSISDVLNITIDEAFELFKDEASIAEKLQLMQEVGLGYLQLGQPAITLSGGEAQRIKLAKELSKKRKWTYSIFIRRTYNRVSSIRRRKVSNCSTETCRSR